MNRAWSSLIALAREGWSVDLGVTSHGIPSEPADRKICEIRAHRWDWHGRVAEVKLGIGQILDTGAPDAEGLAARMSEDLLEVCRRAWRDYGADTIPDMAGHRRLPDGRLAIRPRPYQPEPGGPRDVFPTEAIPAQGDLVPAPEGTSFLASLLEGARDGIDISLRLENSGEERVVTDCLDRDWRWVLSMAKLRDGAGRDISPSGQREEIVLHDLSEGALFDLCRTAVEACRARFAAYAPGGARHGETANSLPPGCLTMRQEYLASNFKGIGLIPAEYGTPADREIYSAGMCHAFAEAARSEMGGSGLRVVIDADLDSPVHVFAVIEKEEERWAVDAFGHRPLKTAEEEVRIRFGRSRVASEDYATLEDMAVYRMDHEKGEDRELEFLEEDDLDRARASVRNVFNLGSPDDVPGL